MQFENLSFSPSPRPEKKNNRTHHTHVGWPKWPKEVGVNRQGERKNINSEASHAHDDAFWLVGRGGCIDIYSYILFSLLCMPFWHASFGGGLVLICIHFLSSFRDFER